MSFENDIRTLWLSISTLTIALGDARDSFLTIPGEETRFMDLEGARKNLFEIETALFEYLEQKAPLLGKKPDRLMYIVAQSAIENSKLLLDLAKGEASLKSVAPDGKLTFEQNMILVQNRVNDPKILPERKAKLERIIKMGLGAKRSKFLKSMEAK